VQFPGINPKWFALGAYVIFIGLNWIGVGIAAAFELFVTVLAIVELLVFMGVVTPGWTLANFTANGWAGGSVLNGAASRASSRRSRSPSGSSWPSRARPWRPKRRATRTAPFPSRTPRASSRWWCWPSA
jgi:hypothetical protein